MLSPFLISGGEKSGMGRLKDRGGGERHGTGRLKDRGKRK